LGGTEGGEKRVSQTTVQHPVVIIVLMRTVAKLRRRGRKRHWAE